MKKLILLILLLIPNCGYTAKDNEGTGQVKKITNETPILCLNFKAADITFGSMQTGAISITHEWFVITGEQEKILKKAAEESKMIKFTYDVRRFAFCTDPADHVLTNVEIITTNQNNN